MFAFSQAAHCCRTASTAAALGSPCVITADSRATTAAPEAIASRTAGAMARALTAAMVRGYIHVCPAGVAELVQAHGLGPCGASHGGSSPFARTIQPHPGGGRSEERRVGKECGWGGGWECDEER